MIEFEANVVSEKPDGGKRWTRIGVAFRTRSGNGLVVKLDAHPKGDELYLFPPRPRDDYRGALPAPPQPATTGGEDDLPF